MLQPRLGVSRAKGKKRFRTLRTLRLGGRKSSFLRALRILRGGYLPILILEEPTR